MSDVTFNIPIENDEKVRPQRNTSFQTSVNRSRNTRSRNTSFQTNLNRSRNQNRSNNSPRSNNDNLPRSNNGNLTRSNNGNLPRSNNNGNLPRSNNGNFPRSNNSKKKTKFGLLGSMLAKMTKQKLIQAILSEHSKRWRRKPKTM